MHVLFIDFKQVFDSVDKPKFIQILQELRIPNKLVQVPVAARSKAWVCGRSPGEIVGPNPTGGMDVCLL